VINPIAANDSVVVNCEVKVTDSAGHHLTTGNIYWQVKSWSKVKTKA
jgi:hypothetical protein